MRLIVFFVCISLAFGQMATEFCNENTSEAAQKLSTSENITSLNYPGEYKSNMDCYIRRYTDFTHLKIKFFRVELEPHYDELYIFNGLVSREDIESGAVEPDHTITNMEDEIILGSEVTLRLKSDESAEFEGVTMEISPYDVDDCEDGSYDVIESFRCVCKNGFTGDGVSCTEMATEFCNVNTSEAAQKLSTNENITSISYLEWNDTNMDCYIRRYTDYPHLKIKFFRHQVFTMEFHKFFSLELELNHDMLYIFNGLVSKEDIESGAVEPDHTISNMDHTISNMEDEIILGSEVTLHLKSNQTFVFTDVTMEISPYDVDECADSSTNNCDVNAHCQDVIGSFKCVCEKGFTGDGVSCTDINECTTNNHTCTENSICANLFGHYTCTCKHGFQQSGSQCIDINECVENSKICSNQAVCNNLPGSYKCVCANGYKGDGRVCQDIDECASSSKDINQCSVDAVCSNTIGSYDCTCKAGYKGDGRTCVEC